MATETSSNSNGFLYFIVGVLLVGMIVLVFMFYNGSGGGASQGPIEKSAAAVGEAADKVTDAAKTAPSGGGG